MNRNNLLSAVAIAVSLFTTGAVHAHSGDHSFMQAFEEYSKTRLATTRGAAPDRTSTATALTIARETANLYGAVRNENGETLLPAGTTCDDLTLSENGILTAYFTLPPYYDPADLSELKGETIYSMLRVQTALIEAPSIFVKLRENADTDYGLYGDFLPPVIPPGGNGETHLDAGAPLPSKASSSQAAVPQPGTSAVGQSPLGSSTQPAGALSGRVVYFSAGHGWYWTGTTWAYQRPVDLQGMNEDLGNQDQAQFFAQYLFNAGATVVPMRPVGHQPNAVVVDNPAAVFEGPWSDSSDTRYYGSGVPYRFANKSAEETATARFTPTIPQAGFYPIYVWANYGGNRVDNQLYKVKHTGGTSEVRINHRRVGRGWIWIGTYYMNAGANPETGSVVVSNQTTTANGDVIIADAVRFGNGIGPSGRLRENEAATYWVREGFGVGDTVNRIHNYSSDGYPTEGDNSNTVNTPPRNAAYMTNNVDFNFYNQVYVGWHTNAGGGRGSEAVVHNTSTPTNAYQLGGYLSDTLDADFALEVGNWEITNWTNRRQYAEGAYGEVSSSHLGGELSGALIEVAFHDSASDALLLRDPKVRNAAGRSIYRGVLKYFNNYSAAPKPPLTYLPEPPVNLRVINNGAGSANIFWAAPPTGGANGHAATGYRVYMSTDGYGYGLIGTTSGVAATTFNVTGLTPGQTYYFRVAATNAGGESMPTESLAARITASGTPNTLVVNGYDRLDRFNNALEPGYTSTERIRLRRNNSYDYLIEHGSALQAVGRDFDSTSNEAVALGNVNLTNCQNVIWLLGEENEKDQTLSTVERTLVSSFLNGGGRLFITGSEVGRHLKQLAVDAPFYNNMLKADLAADDAGAYQAVGAPGSALSGIAMVFSPDADMYDVDSPDRLIAVNGSTLAASYTGTGTGGAAVQYDGDYRLMYFGFPFEAINSATTRQQVMAAVLNFFDAAPASSVDDWALF